ncbi:MAG: GNAT family N-acetyltransferase [Oscillospiraceae bacterium]|nr:GNAT family N-acetyltransferase [Oscillospiraceae bacterium]
MITFTDKRCFSQQQLQELFKSVNWLSADYPERLYKALNNCETVFTAWDNDLLVGLINAIDDGELTAYVHYLLVRPEYQKVGIGKELLRLVREKYKDYLYVELIAESRELIGYYEKNGFNNVQDVYVMGIMNK